MLFAEARCFFLHPTSKPRPLPPCHCLPRFPPSFPIGVVPPAPEARLPLPPAGRAPQRSPSRPRGAACAPGASGARALRAGGRVSLPVRSCRPPPSPTPLSGVAALAPSTPHYPIASRFTRRLGAGEPELSLSTLQGRRGCGRGGGGALGAPPRALRPEPRLRLRLLQMRAAPASPAAAHPAPSTPPPRDGVSIPALLPGSPHVAMETAAAGRAGAVPPGDGCFISVPCVHLLFL